MNTTKAKERFRKEFEREDGLINKYSVYPDGEEKSTIEAIAIFLESELLLAHQAGREEMKRECLAAVPEKIAGHYADGYVGSVMGHNDCREQAITNIENIK